VKAEELVVIWLEKRRKRGRMNANFGKINQVVMVEW